MHSESKPSSSAEVSFFESAPSPGGPRPNRRWIRGLQFVIFAVLIGLSVYPYIRHQLPVVERLTHPSSRAERLADAHLRKRQFKIALALYKRALKKRDLLSGEKARRLGRLHLKMAICTMHMRQFNNAIIQAEMALKKFKRWKSPLPHRILLQLYPQQRQSRRFVQISEQVKRQFPSDRLTWVLIGDGFLWLKRHKEASKSYQEGLQRFPKDLELLNHYARLLATTRDISIRNLPKAMKLSEKAYKLSGGKHFDTLNTLVGVNIQMRYLNKAEELARKALMIAQLRRDKQRALQQMLMIRKMRKERAAALARPPVPGAVPFHRTVPPKTVVQRTPVVPKAPHVSRPPVLRRVVPRLVNIAKKTQVMLRPRPAVRAVSRPVRRKTQPWKNPFLPSRRTHGRSRRLLVPAN
jgi:tetratricopeptide (TPR) repeat protein